MARKRVVVVDDEQDIRDLLVIWLRDDPRCDSVSEAADLDSAVQLAERNRPDAILLDFFLGRRLCVEVLPAMRSLCPQARIIVYTASRRAAEAASVLAVGADMVLEKGSVSVDELVALLVDDDAVRELGTASGSW
jgi:two-component system nitrate/nitrite response regulator NarL